MKQIKFLFVTIAFLLFVSAIPEKTTTIFITGDYTIDSKGRDQYLTLDEPLQPLKPLLKTMQPSRFLVANGTSPNCPRNQRSNSSYAKTLPGNSTGF